MYPHFRKPPIKWFCIPHRKACPKYLPLVSDYHYLGSTPLGNKLWFVNPGLTLWHTKTESTRNRLGRRAAGRPRVAPGTAARPSLPERSRNKWRPPEPCLPRTDPGVKKRWVQLMYQLMFQPPEKSWTYSLGIIIPFQMVCSTHENTKTKHQAYDHWLPNEISPLLYPCLFPWTGMNWSRHWQRMTWNPARQRLEWIDGLTQKKSGIAHVIDFHRAFYTHRVWISIAWDGRWYHIIWTMTYWNIMK